MISARRIHDDAEVVVGALMTQMNETLYYCVKHTYVI